MEFTSKYLNSLKTLPHPNTLTLFGGERKERLWRVRNTREKGKIFHIL